mmetsp:Transcript_31576/g.51080  ORF Transcript_31576/g.51080 Transcript_31576/m.51080 type:complete len:101 (-) Transcript_31576:261-563(-)
MVFVENGRVVERRSMMRAGTISAFFWGLLNTLYCFFHCMISPSAAEDFQAGRYQGPFGNGGPGSGGGWGGGGGRGGRRGPNIGGINRPDSMDAPPMGGGG